MENKVKSISNQGYSKQIVVFLDVLGFSDATIKSQNDKTLYNNICSLLAEFQNIISVRTKYFNINVHAFSDSIVLSCPTISEKSFDNMNFLICEFCLKTISYGFFIRGALTTGLCCEKNGTLFGPACVHAYEMEKTSALWPRCIIDLNSLLDPNIYPNNSWKSNNQCILTDENEIPYLNYLGYAINIYLFHSNFKAKKNVVEAIHDLDEGPNVILRLFEGHKNAILLATKNAKQNEKEKDKLVNKYISLANYHNLVIQRIQTDKNNYNDINKIKKSLEYLTGDKIDESDIRELFSDSKEFDYWNSLYGKQMIDVSRL